MANQTPATVQKTSVHALYEGTFSVGLDKEFYRIERSESPRKGALKLSINPFLVSTRDRNVLIDAGLGDLFGGDTTIETILENLEHHGISNYEITDVILSHLHFDHVAGLAHRANGYWELTFPDAKIHLSDNGWKKLHSLAKNLTDDQAQFFHFLDSQADIHFLGEESKPLPGFRTVHMGGHTEFHQVIYYADESLSFVMAGDILGTRGAINKTYAAKYDYEPKRSMAAREELQAYAFQEKAAILAYHDSINPVFRLTNHDETKGYTLQNGL
ncbi:MAG: MBL fold metallo-hydrolase [Balneolaceae bacterium]